MPQPCQQCVPNSKVQLCELPSSVRPRDHRCLATHATNSSASTREPTGSDQSHTPSDRAYIYMLAYMPCVCRIYALCVSSPCSLQGTTISPWVVTLPALEAARCAPHQQDPAPLPYLTHSPTAAPSCYDIHLTVDILPAGCSVPTQVTATSSRSL